LEKIDLEKIIRIINNSGKKINKQKRRLELVNILEDALKNDREFIKSVYLDDTIEDLISDLRLTIIDRGSKLEIDLAPISGEGHDFNFLVKKRSKRIVKDSLMVGEVISEHED
jgi:hypothetical protein